MTFLDPPHEFSKIAADHFALDGNYPNPFRDQTMIQLYALGSERGYGVGLRRDGTPGGNAGKPVAHGRIARDAVERALQ